MIYKYYATDIADLSRMQDACHMKFVIDRAHRGVSVVQWKSIGVPRSLFRVNVIGVYYRVLNRIKLLVTLCLKSHLTLNNDLHALSHSAALKIRQKIYFINLRTTSSFSRIMRTTQLFSYYPTQKNKHRHAMHARVIFGGGGSLETL